jgi:hypothetical protein
MASPPTPAPGLRARGSRAGAPWRGGGAKSGVYKIQQMHVEHWHSHDTAVSAEAVSEEPGSAAQPSEAAGTAGSEGAPQDAAAAPPEPPAKVPRLLTPKVKASPPAAEKARPSASVWDQPQAEPQAPEADRQVEWVRRGKWAAWEPEAKRGWSGDKGTEWKTGPWRSGHAAEWKSGWMRGGQAWSSGAWGSNEPSPQVFNLWAAGRRPPSVEDAASVQKSEEDDADEAADESPDDGLVVDATMGTEEDVQTWDTLVLPNLMHMAAIAGCDSGQVGDVRVFRLKSNKTDQELRVVRVPLGGMKTPEKKASTWYYVYKGFHGTDAKALIGILEARQVLAMETGSRGVYTRATADAGEKVLLKLLYQTMVGTKAAADGVVFELTCHAERAHVKVKAGGVEGEIAASQSQSRVTHLRQGSESRWTFPPKRTEVNALWLNMETFAAVDPEKVVTMMSMFS